MPLAPPVLVFADLRSAVLLAEARLSTPRQLERLLDVPQPRVSELVNGKISRMTADLLGKYLYRLSREIEIKTKTSRKRSAAMA